MKKFKLTKTFKIENGVKLFQVQSLKDFSNIKKGELGGWVEKEKNLSQEGNCWIYDNARIYDNAWKKSPPYIKGTKFSANVCKYNFIRIGCLEFSFEHWLKNYKTIGKENDFTNLEIKEYGEIIKMLIKLYKLGGNWGYMKK
jgi:hypothetical protein